MFVVKVFVVKLKDEYLTGACDNLGRYIMTTDPMQAYFYTKDQAEAVKAGDARLKEAQIIPVQENK